jgi:hypothetical protein
MARIHATTRGWNTVVTVSGQLGARDMRRLEHACAPALTCARLALVVDVTGVHDIDAVAERLLQRMVLRGAVIRTRP